jgi:hypothetical protein
MASWTTMPLAPWAAEVVALTAKWGERLAKSCDRRSSVP